MLEQFVGHKARPGYEALGFFEATLTVVVRLYVEPQRRRLFVVVEDQILLDRKQWFLLDRKQLVVGGGVVGEAQIKMLLGYSTSSGIRRHRSRETAQAAEGAGR